MIPILLSIVALILTAIGIFQQKNPLYFLLSLFCFFFSGWIGMEFSPSYTAIFLFVYFGLVLLSFLITLLPFPEPIGKSLSSFVSLLGSLFLWPSILVYLRGDNNNDLDTLLAVIISVLFLLVLLFMHRKSMTFPKFFSILEQFGFCSSAVLALLAGITSTALFPYGLGVLVCLISKYLKNPVKDPLFTIGLFITNVFFWAPMVFGG